MIEGATYWIDDNSRIRQFTVAEPDDSAAREILKTKLNGNIKFLARTQLDGSVVKFLNQKPGTAAEWISADGSPMDPKFGSEKLS
ncbi:hypothetical protein [Bradyrhizobium sp. WSM4349]|uniref:hypothetical protein n=1 Tax=Bradyrhizobium sp. WSM4349 TaxID=1040988 RepID=UPI00036D876E|nr:hypothetical protein [Bradyrhizobium sp. WSM4349]